VKSRLAVFVFVVLLVGSLPAGVGALEPGGGRFGVDRRLRVGKRSQRIACIRRNEYRIGGGDEQF